MTRIKLPYVSVFKDRHGKNRWRFRRTGYATQYLRGEFGSTEFMADYALALEGKTVAKNIGSERTRTGSIDSLCVKYYRSIEFAKLSDSSKQVYTRQLEAFRQQHGSKRVDKLRRKHVKAIIARMSDTPSAADNLLKRLKVLFKFAVEEEMIAANPAQGVKGFNKPSTGHRTWTEADISLFKSHFKSGTKERLALELLLCTAQRGSDVARMGWQHIDTAKGKVPKLRIIQKKTGTALTLPILPELQRELSATPKTNMTFLVTEYGRPFSIKGFQQWFSKRAKIAGIEPKICDDNKLRSCTAHGLRKAAATRLADHGCDDRLIMAVTGHKTASEVTRYTMQRDQEKGAERAFKLFTDGRKNV